MFQVIPLPMWVFDAETFAFLDVNEAAIDHYGYTREEFLNMTAFDIRPPDDVAALRHNLHENAGLYYAGVWRHIKKDGSLIYVEITADEVVFNGRRARVVAALDVTERRHLEELRDRHVHQLQLLAETALRLKLSLTIEDSLGIITEQARALIGAHQAVTSLAAEGSANQIIQCVSLSDKYAAWRTYDNVPTGQGIYMLASETNRPLRLTQAALEAHPRWRKFSGHAPQHPPMRGWLVVPLIGRSGENIGLIQLSDKEEGEFTQDDENMMIQLAGLAAASVENARLYDQLQRHAEELEQRVEERTAELRQANQRLTELDALKTRFISEVSHELRNPITLLSFKVATLKRGDAAARERAIAGLEDLTTQLMDLTEHVLDLSRVELSKDRVNFEPVDLRALAERSVDIYQAEIAAHGLTLKVELNDVPPVMGEKYQLTQVLTNLLSNAIKYTPSGGIRVRLGYDEMRREVCLSVQDTGLGIDAEDVPHLFDRFYRGKNVSQSAIPGTGLGLPIVGEIAKLHGGRVEIESTPGVGSTFRVHFPAA